MEELPLPELTSEQMETLCSIAEQAVREYVLFKVPSKRIETLSIVVEAEGARPVTLTIDIDIVVSPILKDVDAQKVVDGAVKEAFGSAEKYLRALTCHLQK